MRDICFPLEYNDHPMEKQHREKDNMKYEKIDLGEGGFYFDPSETGANSIFVEHFVIDMEKESKANGTDLIASEEVLDNYGIPHKDKVVDLDAWAAQFDCTIEDGMLIDEEGRKAVAFSPFVGHGWASIPEVNQEEAKMNLVILTMLAHHGNSDITRFFEPHIIIAIARSIYNLICDDEDMGFREEGFLGCFFNWVPQDIEYVVEENNGDEKIHYDSPDGIKVMSV